MENEIRKYYYTTGELASEHELLDNIPNGKEIYYWKNGLKRSEGYLYNWKNHGLDFHWSKYGHGQIIRKYKRGILIGPQIRFKYGN